MASIKIHHLVKKPGAQGMAPRYFWEPSPHLRKAGWHTRRIPDNWPLLTDRAELEAAAIAAAQAINHSLADGRRAATPAPLPVVHTIDALIAGYKASKDFTELRSSTRRGYVQCLERIGHWAGPAPVTAITWQRIEKLQEAMAATELFQRGRAGVANPVGPCRQARLDPA